MPIESIPEVRTSPSHSPRSARRKAGGWIRLFVYLLVIGGLGYIVWRVYKHQQHQQAQAQLQAAAIYGRPVPVQVTTVDQKAMPIYLSALGTVTPYMSITVKARVNGELEPVHFTEGQMVRQGETIMVIDPRPYQAALDQAKGTLAHDEALLRNAQAEYARYKALFDAGVVSKETLDADESAQGQYEGAIAADKAAIETAQLQLNWCTIHSPIDGKIGLRLIDPGNIVSANTTNLVVINQMQPIAVYFTLPENQLPQVLGRLNGEKRLPVEAYDRSDTHKIASGVLLTADNQIDTTTGTDKLKAVFDNRDGSLFPNQFVNIRLVLENRANALVVPSVAIQNGLQGPFVWTMATDDKGQTVARIKPVKVTLAEGQLSIVDSGIARGDQVVVDGADRLRPEQPVIAGTAHPRPAVDAEQAPPGENLFSPSDSQTTTADADKNSSSPATTQNGSTSPKETR